jgi:hypothetical protein
MRAIIVALILLWPCIAIAADQCTKQIYSDPNVEPDYSCPGPGEDAMVPKIQLRASVELKAKQASPWSGILMDKNRVLVLGLRIKGLRRIRWQENNTCRESLAAEKKFMEDSFNATIKLRTSQRDSYKAQNVDLRKEIVRLNRWYRSPTFWFVTGVLVTAAGATALAYGLRK